MALRGGGYDSVWGVPALYHLPDPPIGVRRRVPQSLLLRRHYLRPPHAAGAAVDALRGSVAAGFQREA
ncbi:MAG TPA: hypothetical protein PLL53_07390, partial [Saprospiraceae bacterium]|nr:hypothetical protein [Saprospiraceae bacterium]